MACRSLCVRSFVQRAAADHIASCKGSAQKNRNHEKNAEELLVAEQNLRFAVVGPQHFYLKLYLRFAPIKIAFTFAASSYPYIKMYFRFKPVFGVVCALMAGWLLMDFSTGGKAVYAASDMAPTLSLLPGMPPVFDTNNLYSADRADLLSPVVKNFPSRVYVPNSKSDSVDIIDPSTYKIVGHFSLPKHPQHPKGRLEPQHVVPSWDLKKLWVAQDLGDQLTLIDPATAKQGETIHVDDPYNMYYTPDGKYAIVMAERERRIDFRDAQTHEGREQGASVIAKASITRTSQSMAAIMIATCEFSSELIKVDVAEQKVLAHLKLTPKGMPQDCRVSPDGKVFYVANMEANGVHLIDGDAFKQIGFIKTGKGAHGLYFSS